MFLNKEFFVDVKSALEVTIGGQVMFTKSIVKDS